jgi:hypothetical protein
MSVLKNLEVMAALMGSPEQPPAEHSPMSRLPALAAQMDAALSMFERAVALVDEQTRKIAGALEALPEPETAGGSEVVATVRRGMEAYLEACEELNACLVDGDRTHCQAALQASRRGEMLLGRAESAMEELREGAVLEL